MFALVSGLEFSCFVYKRIKFKRFIYYNVNQVASKMEMSI